MKILIAILSIIICSCADVTVPKIYGKPLEKKEMRKILGKWKASSVGEFSLTENEEKANYNLTNLENQFTSEANITTVGNNNRILWVTEKKTKRYIPIKIIPHPNKSSAFLLLHPDFQEVERLVSKKQLKGSFIVDSDNEKSCLLEDYNIKKHIQINSFWNLESTVEIQKANQQENKSQ